MHVFTQLAFTDFIVFIHSFIVFVCHARYGASLMALHELLYLDDMQAYDLRKEAGRGVDLCLRGGEVHIRRLWEAKKVFSKGRQLNLVLKDEKEFFIWTWIKEFKQPAFWEIGTKNRRQSGTLRNYKVLLDVTTVQIKYWKITRPSAREVSKGIS